MKLKLLSCCALLVLTSTLSSCSHLLRHKDGPPRYRVDVSRIPNAKPKVEPRAKYGNMPSYKVFGKRYHTLPSAKNYEKTGVASWYGTKFHSQKTSSGEPYNMLAMTAAHKTLPLPTYVEVTNLENRRKVIVKVNDRGPFSGNRLIDLSYVAAKKLGMLAKGTAKVRIRALDPTKYYRSTWRFAQETAKKHQSHHITQRSANIFLQAGAFKHKNNAHRLQKRLNSLVQANVTVHKPSGRSQLYKVRIGPVSSQKQANKIIDKLSLIGIKPNTIKGA